MGRLKELTLQRFEGDIEREQEKKRLYVETKEFYEKKLLDSPSLKYILSAWIMDLDNNIKGCDVQIDFLQQELKLFIEKPLNITYNDYREED